jgi:hypothetical protein
MKFAVNLSLTGCRNSLQTTCRYTDLNQAEDCLLPARFFVSPGPANKPVAFRYKKEIDPAGTSQFGLVAEDVEKVNPDLVIRDPDRKAYTVRYDKVQQQEATITQLKKDLQATAAHQQKQIEARTAGLQRVSAQLELSKPAPQVVNNNQ